MVTGIMSGESYEALVFNTRDNIATLTQWIHDKGADSNIVRWQTCETRETTMVDLLLDRSFYGREEDMYEEEIPDGYVLMRSLRSNRFYIISPGSFERLYDK